MKKLLIIATLGAALLTFTSQTFAALDLCAGITGPFCFQPESLGGVVGKLVMFIFIIAIIVALVFLVYGGLKWIVSGGDKGKVEEARGTIIAAVIGLIVVFLSYFILNFVLSLFGMDVSTLELPTLT